MDMREGVWTPDSYITYTVSQWAIDYPGIVLSFASALLLCGMALGIRHIYRRMPEKTGRKLYNRVIRNPWSKVTGPFRRLHHRWSMQNQGKQMAKWKKGHLADVVQEAFWAAHKKGIISRQEYKQLVMEVGTMFGLDDLLPRKGNIGAVKARIEANCAKMEKELALCNPKIPGGKPGENTSPVFEDLGSSFIAKMKARISKPETVETPAPKRVVL